MRLKHLAILGLLVVGLVYGAWSQVPSDGSQQQNNTQKKANPAQDTQPVALAIQAQGGAHKQEKSTQEPPGYPWKELLAPANVPNWALVLVGGITGWFVYKTLRAIKKQAEIMEAQATDARESGTQTFAVLKEQTDNLLISAKAATVTAMAANDSAKAANAQIQAMKDRERARLGIRSIDVPEVFGPERILEGMCHLRVCAYVENLGHSKAFNVRVYGILDIVSDPESCPREKGFLQPFPQIIDEGPRQHLLKLGGFGREFEDVASSGDAMAVSKEMIREIRDGKAFIQASGKLAYQDIFGDGHTIPFRFVWKSVGDDDGGKWLTRSFWLECNPPSDEQDEPE
jgi:hypothetical protein